MNNDVRPLRCSRLARTALAALVLAILSATSAMGQSAAKPGVTIGAQLEGGSYFAMPNVSVLLTAGFPVAGGHLEIAPRVGGSYLFFPMTGLSGNWYVPVGLEFRFTQQELGIVIQNLVSIDNTLGEGGVTAGVEGYLPFAKSGKSSFSMAVEAGAAYFWNTATKPLILVRLSASLRYDYQVKPAS